MIEAKGLTKNYGEKRAVDGLTFTVQPGIVTGFLGPNGSGKSTTMRLILGLDRPSAGTVTVNGKHYRDFPAPLHEVARKRAGQFSLGMGQRLGIAAALLGDPKTVLLDEPVNGLDPEGIHWIRNLLKQLASEGRTVFVSSHLMSEMALTAEHLIVIGRGKLIADTSVEEFTRRAGKTVVRVRSPQATQLRDLVLGRDIIVESVEPSVLEVSGVTAEQIGDIAAKHNIVLHELTPKQASLEEAFMELTRDEVEFKAVAA